MKLPFLKDTPLKIPYTAANGSAMISNRLSSMLEHLAGNRPIVVVCIGTDRSTGDALGPLIGSSLSKHNNPQFSLFGTLENPVHAMNLDDTLMDINRRFKRPFVIGIDACLGQVASVGNIQIGIGPVRPGAGVNKDLPPVGDIHITGIVNVGGFMEYFVLQNTRLHLVISMAETITAALHTAIMNHIQLISARSQTAADFSS